MTQHDTTNDTTHTSSLSWNSPLVAQLLRVSRVIFSMTGAYIPMALLQRVRA
jgi:hypothetical protein